MKKGEKTEEGNYEDITYQTKCLIKNLYVLLCLAQDHRRGFSTRNAHMVHIVN